MRYSEARGTLIYEKNLKSKSRVRLPLMRRITRERAYPAIQIGVPTSVWVSYVHVVVQDSQIPMQTSIIKLWTWVMLCIEDGCVLLRVNFSNNLRKRSIEKS
jgi:hypothetical protein